jgi:hypothetical protein
MKQQQQARVQVRPQQKKAQQPIFTQQQNHHQSQSKPATKFSPQQNHQDRVLH